MASSGSPGSAGGGSHCEASDVHHCSFGVAEGEVGECTLFGPIHERKVELVELRHRGECRSWLPEQHFRYRRRHHEALGLSDSPGRYQLVREVSGLFEVSDLRR